MGGYFERTGHSAGGSGPHGICGRDGKPRQDADIQLPHAAVLHAGGVYGRTFPFSESEPPEIYLPALLERDGALFLLDACPAVHLRHHGEINHYSFHDACLGIISGWGQWWFLPCLFILQLMFAAYHLLRRAVPGAFGAVAAFIILFACVFSINRFGGAYLSDSGLQIHYVLSTYRMFPAFALGVALFEFPIFKRLVLHGRVIPLLAVVLFALLCRDYTHFHMTYGWMLTGLAGCVIMLRLFSGISSAQTQAGNMGGTVLRQFKHLGKSSMAIYVLSYLLIPAAPLFTDTSVPQLAVFCGNLLLGLVICYACMGLKAVINLSPLLSAAFLGEFPKRKKEEGTLSPN